MAATKKETRRARANRRILEVCRALRIPESQIAELERDPELTEKIKYAISLYTGMRREGLLVYEEKRKPKK